MPSLRDLQKRSEMMLDFYFLITVQKNLEPAIGVNASSIVILKITFDAGCCIQSTIHQDGR